jgi:hypothetical protein
MFKFFIPAIFLSFAATLYFGYTQHGFAEINSFKTDIGNIDRTLEINRNDINMRRIDLEKKRESITQTDRDKLDRLLPSVATYDEAGFLNDMNNIVLRRNMIPVGLSVSGLDKDAQNGAGGEYKKVKVSFSVSCTYSAFKVLLNDLEKSDQLLDITSMSFSDASDAKESHYQVAIDTYFWVPLANPLTR